MSDVKFFPLGDSHRALNTLVCKLTSTLRRSSCLIASTNSEDESVSMSGLVILPCANTTVLLWTSSDGGSGGGGGGGGIGESIV